LRSRPWLSTSAVGASISAWFAPLRAALGGSIFVAWGGNPEVSGLVKRLPTISQDVHTLWAYVGESRRNWEVNSVAHGPRNSARCVQYLFVCCPITSSKSSCSGSGAVRLQWCNRSSTSPWRRRHPVRRLVGTMRRAASSRFSSGAEFDAPHKKLARHRRARAAFPLSQLITSWLAAFVCSQPGSSGYESASQSGCVTPLGAGGSCSKPWTKRVRLGRDTERRDRGRSG